MVLALVPTISKPCTTSGLVSRKVTGVPAGTRISLGWNANIMAIAVTVTLPSGLVATPRWVNRASLQTAVGSMVSMWLGGRVCSLTRPKTMVPKNSAQIAPALHIQKRSYRSICMADLRGHRPAREIDEEEEGEPADGEEHAVEANDRQGASGVIPKVGALVGHETLRWTVAIRSTLRSSPERPLAQYRSAK